jgi:peptide/nickel transport system ATP-binding protein
MEIFANPQHPYTKGLLACRPPLDRRLKWLPTVADFMGTDENGNIVEKAHTISEVLNKAIVTKEERDVAHKTLYAKEPVLSIRNLKTYFPIKSGFFGKQKTM